MSALCIRHKFLILFAALYIVYSATSYTFSESDGTVESVIKVQKHSMSPPTEVDIPVIITTIDGMGTATAGEGL